MRIEEKGCASGHQAGRLPGMLNRVYNKAVTMEIEGRGKDSLVER